MIYLESYNELLEEINDYLLEGSSTAQYLNHHSTFGNFFAPGVYNFLNGYLKRDPDSKFSAASLYPKYIKYCMKKAYKPISKKEFVEEANKYYKAKRGYDKNKMIAGLVPKGELIFAGVSEYKRRQPEFIDKAKMRHDL